MNHPGKHRHGGEHEPADWRERWDAIAAAARLAAAIWELIAALVRDYCDGGGPGRIL